MKEFLYGVLNRILELFSKASEKKPPPEQESCECFEYSRDGQVNEVRVSENFMLDEFQCPCCKQVKLHPKLLSLAQELRKVINAPIVPTTLLGFAGAYRCEERNTRAGGAPNSFHLYGMAIDVAVDPTGLTAGEFADRAIDVGFKGIGIYSQSGFVHIDCRETDEAIVFHDDTRG